MITGVTSGIGEALTAEYLKKGWKVTGIARREEKLKTMREIYGDNFSYIVWDISRVDGLKSLIEEIDRINPQTDLLINNAGRGSHGEFSQGECQEEIEMIRLNIEALTYMTKAYLKRMTARNSGGIINVASTAAFQEGGPLMAAYYGSKSYVLTLDEGVRGELEMKKGNRVRVMTLCPGPTATNFAGMNNEAERRFYITSPQEVARECYRGYEAGREIVVPGVINKISAALSSLIPRKIQRRIIYRIQKNKRP